MELAKVSCAEDPQKAAENPSASLGIRNKGPIHGIADGNFPSVLPLGKNIRFVTGGDITISRALSAARVEVSLVEGLRAPGTKLRLRRRTPEDGSRVVLRDARDVAMSSRPSGPRVLTI
jgi:hypothetical protein